MSFTPLYNPFDKFRFDQHTCFLTGNSISSADQLRQVFPSWLMNRYQLEDQPFKLLDERITTYRDLKIPCSPEVGNALDELEAEVRAAFESGYEATSKLPPLRLFQWITKLVYGIIFTEIQTGIRQQLAAGEAMNFSQVLRHKFSNLHLMLQSLIRPVTFEGTSPFTIYIVKLDQTEDQFSYRDEINTLIFSLKMNGFGIIASLQDNGANGRYHQELLSKIEGHSLHPLQFEELCARFFYSGYLFNRLPEYSIIPTEENTFIEPLSLSANDQRPIFDTFQVKTYGQVLENFWKPWNILLFEIIKDPERPLSFLLDSKGTPIPGNELSLLKNP